MKWTLTAVRRLGIVVAAVVLAACAGTATRESMGEYVDDTAITTQVKSALMADKQTSAWAVNVETFKGVVQLSGFVGSNQERAKAEQIAGRVKGVKAVENDIRVK